MVFLYRRFQFLQTRLSAPLRRTGVFVACEHLDNPQVLSLLQQVGDHALADGLGIQFPVREQVPKSFYQVVDIIGFDCLPPDVQKYNPANNEAIPAISVSIYITLALLVRF